jgi:hypothetical protein
MGSSACDYLINFFSKKREVRKRVPQECRGIRE